MQKLRNVHVISRPGYFGKKRKEIENQLNIQYPNWKECWQIGDLVFGFDEAVTLYDDAYYKHIEKSHELIKWIVSFGECYDSDRSNIACGINHDLINSPRHIQDVSVRRALIRLGTYFDKYKGPFQSLYDENELLHIRSEDSNGFVLMPGNVPFHMPDVIVENNNVKSWCKPDSVEYFWQANKIIVMEK